MPERGCAGAVRGVPGGAAGERAAVSRPAGALGRNTHAYRLLREQQRRKFLPCWLCGQAIDYDADWRNPASFALDHAKPLSTHPDLAQDPANFRSAHRRCNASRGAKEPAPSLGVTSRSW